MSGHRGGSSDTEVTLPSLDGPSRGSFKVIYASQTGTAEDLAARLAQAGQRRRYAVHVFDVAEYDIVDLVEEEDPVVFLVSTTGNGDFPTSASSFWRFLLRADLPVDSLSDLRFAVLGLGDSSYLKFCWAARLLRRRLQGLGATEYIAAQDADDQHPLGVEGALDPFLSQLWSMLANEFPLPGGLEEIPDEVLLPPSIQVNLTDEVVDPEEIPGPSTPHVGKGRELARLTVNKRMTAEKHFQDVRLLEFEHYASGANGDAGQPPMDYRPGDVLCLKPQNSEVDVERFIARMGWANHKHRIVTLTARTSSRKIPADVPARITLFDLVRDHLDICSVPRASFFHAIRRFSPVGEMEREKLDEYCTPGEGADEMFDYAQRVRRTILEVLEEFGTVEFGIKYLLDVVPFLKQREFSIASDRAYLQWCKPGPPRVQLAVAIVKYKTRLREPRRGVCTAWLSTLPVGAVVPYTLAQGSLQLPPHDDTPVVYVGPGTGVAPMRAFLQSRLLHVEQERESATGDNVPDGAPGKADPGASDVEPCGRNRVYLGFRNAASDVLFRSDWERWGDAGLLTWQLAASRDPVPADEKELAAAAAARPRGGVYVQDLMARTADRAWLWQAFAERGAYILISGSAGKMPEAIRQALAQAAVEEGGLSTEQAERFVTLLSNQGRLQEECWS